MPKVLELLVELRACLHRVGGPQISEVTCGGSPHPSCKRDKDKMRDYMDRRVTPPKRAQSLKNSPLTTIFGKMLYRENMESHLRKLKVS